MTDIIDRILGFLHGPYRDCLYQILFLLAFYIVQQAIQRLRNFRLASSRTNLVAETGDKLAEIIQLVGIRQVMDTIREHFRLFVLGNLSDMLGHRLESRVLLVTGSSSICQNQRKCVQKAGLQVQRLMLQTVADCEVVLSLEEKEMGTILINIGYGTTNMIAYSQGSPIYTGGVAFGGDSITQDLAYILNKPKQVAEQIKCESGSCFVPSVNPNDMVLIPQVGGMPSIRMPRRSLCEIIEPRMAEIFTLLAMELEKVEHQGSFGGGVVLVGGGSLLSGVTELASEIFKLPARIGFPEALPGLDRSYINPKYTTVLGLLKSEAKKLATQSASSQRGEREKGGLGGRLKGLFTKLF